MLLRINKVSSSGNHNGIMVTSVFISTLWIKTNGILVVWSQTRWYID